MARHKARKFLGPATLVLLAAAGAAVFMTSATGRQIRVLVWYLWQWVTMPSGPHY
jgi:Mn2+/Fe2+ NRAMP family transporter